MSKKLYEESNIQGIANAIREKNNTQNQYTHSQMPNAILQIHGEPDLETLTVTENNNYLPSANKDGFSEVIVNVPNSYTNSDEGKVVKNGALVSQTPRATEIAENGTFDTTENNSVTVNVPSGGGSDDEPTVYWGDEAPLSSLGNDGDIYIRSDDVYVFRDSNNKFLKAVNKDYVVTSTSQLLSTHTTAFYKTMEGPAIAIECQINNTYGHKGPILISPVADYVKYTTNLTPWGSVEVDGIVWYIGSFNNYSPSEDSPSIPKYYNLASDLGNVPGTFNSTYASALVKKFLELAVPSLYESVYAKRNGTWQLMAKELNLETLNATRNGLYVPSFPKDGFGEVIVNVSSGEGGSNILYGSEEPLSALGSNGDMFLQTVSSMNAVLPSGYQELPAIEGTGTQYIDTSISIAQTGLSVKAKIAITGANNVSSQAGDGIWGGSWATNGYLMIRYGNSPGILRWHNGGRVSNDAPITLNKWISLETNSTGMMVDGVTYPVAEGANTQNTLSLFFVGTHATGSPSKMRLSRTKVSAGNTILADFVPCKNSNNEIGMYDIIGQSFYGNSGSGTFLAVEENAIISAFLKVNGAWQNLINSDVDDVDTGGGGGNLYTNDWVYQITSEEQITDVTRYTLLYNSSISFGNNGQKVAARLAITDESAHSTLQAGGWNANGMAYYDAENLIGAYGGYNFGKAIVISKAKFWLNRYSGQNKTLIVTVEYLDGNGNWNEIQDLVIPRDISYPSYVFNVSVSRSVYGIRWIHKKEPIKSSSNNITFAGMSVYRGIGQQIGVYTPDSSGIIMPPTGYDGFGPLYIR